LKGSILHELGNIASKSGVLRKFLSTNPTGVAVVSNGEIYGVEGYRSQRV